MLFEFLHPNAKANLSRNEKFYTILIDTKSHLIDLRNECLRLEEQFKANKLTPRQVALCGNDLFNNYYLLEHKHQYCNNLHSIEMFSQNTISESIGPPDYILAKPLYFGIILQDLYSTYHDNYLVLQDLGKEPDREKKESDYLNILDNVKEALEESIDSLDYQSTEWKNFCKF